MTDRKCSKCGVVKAETDFYVRKSGGANTWCKSCYRSWYEARSGGMVSRQCDQCGASMTVTARRASEPSVYCSRTCKNEKRKTLLAAERVDSKPDRACLWCGVAIPKRMRADARFCSESCNSAAHNVTRKMAKRAGQEGRDGDLLSRKYLGDRDGWRCYLCGKRIDGKLNHPNPLAPSVDHLVPLSCGGSNELANLALTHLRCNLSKRAVPQDEQLKLIG